MRNHILFVTLLLFVFCLYQCTGAKLVNHQFPEPVDTKHKPIEYQKKQVFSTDLNVYASNDFEGARLNGFEQFVDDSIFVAHISPENSPINQSPWYAFQIWSDDLEEIQVQLDYGDSKHRYAPKVSQDGENWELLDPNRVEYNQDSTDAILFLKVGREPLWVAAQELMTSTDVKAWCQEQAKHPHTDFSVVGKSEKGRDMLFLNIGEGKAKGKDILAVISRQHPPEVTGFLAMQAFVERILEQDELSKQFLQRYQLMVYPLMNPDGVDLGHWRHNTGGIDLNRDWAYFHQAETRTVAQHIANTAKKNKSEVVLGLDFHSTYYDVYYTFETLETPYAELCDNWLVNIGDALGEDYDINEQSFDLNQPISKGWFYVQFGAEGVVYEIGDNTPREFIEEKGRVSAEELMKLMLERP